MLPISTWNQFADAVNLMGGRWCAVVLAVSIQVAVLTAILFLIDLSLRRRARAVFRYALWLLVLVKLVLPVSIRTPASLGYWVRHDRSAATSPAVEPLEPSRPIASTASPIGPAMTEIAQDTTSRTSDSVVPVSANHSTSSIHEPNAVAPALSTTPIPVAAPSLRPLQPAACIFCGWCVVVALLAILFVRRGFAARRLVADGIAPPADLDRQLADCCATLAMRSNVRLKLTSALHSPAICGLWRPTILLPERLLGTLDAGQMRLVLLHELVHWRRLDLQVHFVQGVLQIVYWFHPAVWFANAMLRRLREQAVDETVLVAEADSARYGETLLDISAARSRVPELSLGLLGLLESRHELAERIRRIVERPLPRSARLGLVGLAAIALAGLVLLPMAGRTEAEQPAQKAAPQKQAKPDTAAEKAAPAEAAEAKPVLSGRIVDDRGEPVTDATVEINPSQGGRTSQAKTDADGRYHFDVLAQPGEFRVSVKSMRCISLRRYDELPRINLAANAAVVRDFTLKRGCPVSIQAVDEQGQPIRGVQIYSANVLEDGGRNSESVATDRQGWAHLGALPPSKSEYIFGASHNKYGFGKLVATLNDPDAVAIHTMTLLVGKEVQGVAVCSDGHPPAGWRINAMPTWWNFGATPSGQVIGEDGSFTLPHIVGGTYNVSISIPTGPQVTTPRIVLPSTNLAEHVGEISVKLGYPSPASMSPIEIKVEYVGGRPQQGFWVHARSLDGAYTGDAYLQPQEAKVTLGPIPHGIYKIEFESTEIESLVLKSVTVPAKDLAVKIQVTGQPTLRGRVVLAESGQPVAEFKVRVEKRRTLRGPNYVGDSKWREFNDAQGRFEAQVAGPGVYIVHVAAEGLAPASSEELNTDADKGREVLFKLGPPGSAADGRRSISGTVVDEQNRPVDGATITSVVQTFGSSPGNNSPSPPSAARDGIAKSVAGAFRLDGLKPGKDYLKISHADFAPLVVEVNVPATKADERPITIALQEGATVRGRIFDAQGKPEPGVALYVDSQAPYMQPRNRRPDEHMALATADQNGSYEFRHLPAGECIIARVKEWETMGVVRQTIRPQNRQQVALDFGGTSESNGQLFVNGSPLANGQLVLSDETPHWGTLRALTTAAADGSFVFRGIPPGRRTLYYYLNEQRQNAVRVGTFAISTAGNALGKIDVHTGRISVRLVKPANLVAENVRMSLAEYNSHWLFLGGDVGQTVPPANSDDPWFFQNVPVGKYEVAAHYNHKQLVTRMQDVELTPAKLEQSVSIKLALGSAKLKARVAEPQTQRADGIRADVISFQIRSADNRFVTYAGPQSDGTIEVGDLVPGDYILTKQHIREPTALVRFTLAENETKELDLTDELARGEAAFDPGFLELYVLTPQGVLLPGCEMKLVGANETLVPSSAQYGRTVYYGPPGKYHLSVSYPGFIPWQQEIDLQPLPKNRSMFEDMSLRVTLQPATRVP